MNIRLSRLSYHIFDGDSNIKLSKGDEILGADNYSGTERSEEEVNALSGGATYMHHDCTKTRVG